MDNAIQTAYLKMIRAAAEHARLDADYRFNPTKAGLNARRAAFRIKREAEKIFFNLKKIS